MNMLRQTRYAYIPWLVVCMYLGYTWMMGGFGMVFGDGIWHGSATKQRPP